VTDDPTWYVVAKVTTYPTFKVTAETIDRAILQTKNHAEEMKPEYQAEYPDIEVMGAYKEGFEP
jgi:hypothetical protein